MKSTCQGSQDLSLAHFKWTPEIAPVCFVFKHYTYAYNIEYMKIFLRTLNYVQKNKNILLLFST